MATEVDDEASRDPARLRDNILRHLPLDCLTTTDARAAAAELQKSTVTRSLPRDDDEFEITGGAMSEEEALEYNGVDLALIANRRIRDLTVAVEAFVRAHNGSDPTSDQVANVLPPLEALLTAIKSTVADGVHEHLIRTAEIIVAEAAATIPKCRTLAVDDAALMLVRSVLGAAASSPHPHHEERFETSWNRCGTGWSPAERIEAAQGYLYLARRAETCDKTVLAALERLAVDPVAAVRFQIASRLVLLYKNARSMMWRLLEDGIRNETRAGVAYGYLGSLNDLQRADPVRVATLILTLLERFSGDDAKALRELGTKILTTLAIWRDVPVARAHVNAIIGNTADDPDRAGDILGVIREPLRVFPEDDIADADSVRARAFAITESLLAAAIAAYDAAAPGGIVSQPLSKAEEERLRHIVGIIDGVARELYFASGAREEDDDATELDPTRARRFYNDATPVIERLIPVGLAPAIHSLLEMLAVLVAVEPARVFQQVHALIHAGRTGGYLGESSALHLVVRIIERYLADYRHLFQSDDALRKKLIEILNLFIEAGWPEALRFAVRLDQVFR